MTSQNPYGSSLLASFNELADANATGDREHIKAAELKCAVRLRRPG